MPKNETSTLSSPSHVMTLRGTVDMLAIPSAASFIILPIGYFDSPA
jgi:hypothetical protein